MMRDRAGERHGKLKVLSFSHTGSNYISHWLCRCDCGKETVVCGGNLTSGNTKSCGCSHKEAMRITGSISGKDKWNWTGGWYFTRDGYVMVQRKDHPRANYKGYVWEHVLIMEAMIKRFLEPGEVVHHCNGNRADNRPFNLRLFASPSEHGKYHAKLANDLGKPYGGELHEARKK